MEQIISIIEAAVPKNTEMVTKFGLTLFNGNLFNLSKLTLSQNYVKKHRAARFALFIVCICCSIVRKRNKFWVS